MKVFANLFALSIPRNPKSKQIQEKIMVTIKQFIADYCSEKTMGIMNRDHIEKVVEKTISDSVLEPMNGRWDDDIDGYPVSIKALLAMAIDRNALEVIDQNCPQAFFRPLFDR